MAQKQVYKRPQRLLLGLVGLLGIITVANNAAAGKKLATALVAVVLFLIGAKLGMYLQIQLELDKRSKGKQG